MIPSTTTTPETVSQAVRRARDRRVKRLTSPFSNLRRSRAARASSRRASRSVTTAGATTRGARSARLALFVGTLFAGMTQRALRPPSPLEVEMARMTRLVALLSGPEAFSATMDTFRHPAFRAVEIAIVGCVAFHGLNGLRAIAAERGWLRRRQS